MSLAFTQHLRTNLILTDFINSNGQFRQQFLDPYGNAHGAYSYVNPTGQLVRVQYSTGSAAAQPIFPFQFSTTPVLSRNRLFHRLERNATIFTTKLFTPAVFTCPAASPGQLESYRKALEEYANETSQFNQ